MDREWRGTTSQGKVPERTGPSVGPTNAQLEKTSVRQWADPRQAWVLQPDEYQYGDATAEPDTGLLLLREYPQPA